MSTKGAHFHLMHLFYKLQAPLPEPELNGDLVLIRLLPEKCFAGTNQEETRRSACSERGKELELHAVPPA